MQGTVIHYDEFTQCGVLLDQAGNPVYFQRHQLPPDAAVTVNQFVSIRPTSRPVRLVADSRPVPEEELNPVQMPYAASPVPTLNVPADWPNWLGGSTAAVTGLLLWLAGRDLSWASGVKAPSLVNSWWGIGAGSLLVYQVINYVAAAPARTLRSSAWLTVLCSVMFHSCNDFQTKATLSWYDNLLFVTLLMAYVLPLFKRS